MDEWDAGDCGVGGSDLGSLFHHHRDVELETIQVGGVRVEVESTSRDNRHVIGRTGEMLWEGSRGLASITMACAAAFQSRSVIELGSGACPLPSLVAAHRGAATVVATDGSAHVVTQAASNLARNPHLVGTARMATQVLKWGDDDDIDRVFHHSPDGFDWVLGADVVYSEHGVQKFFVTAGRLLKPEAKYCAG